MIQVWICVLCIWRSIYMWCNRDITPGVKRIRNTVQDGKITPANEANGHFNHVKMLLGHQCYRTVVWPFHSLTSPPPEVVGHLPSGSMGAEALSRVPIAVSMMEECLETALLFQRVGYMRAFRGTGGKGWLVIIQHLIIIWAGSQSRTCAQNSAMLAESSV